jgi:hypothetical protein
MVLGASGTLFQFGGIGFTRNGFGGNCQGLNFYENGLLTSVDFCYLLDCQNGFLGGAVQPCSNNNLQYDDLLVDCPTPVFIVTDQTTTPGQNQNQNQNQGG